MIMRALAPRCSRCARLGAVALVGLALACGGDGDAAAPHDPFEALDLPLQGSEPIAVAVPLRRLTRNQLHHTVHDLLGEALTPTLDVRELLPPDDEHGGFASNSTVPLTALAVEQIERAAEVVAAAATARRAHLHPCLDDPGPPVECLEAWVDALAPRAFRRPLAAGELELLHALVQPEPSPARADEDPTDAAIRRTLSAILQSPDFLYRSEAGEPTDDPEVLRLTPHELAARLSYLLWSSLPDEPLLADAAAGRLHDPAVRVRQLERMLADPRARRGLADFHAQWLELDELPTLEKDRNVFPTYDPDLRPLLQQELETFVDFAIRHDDGRFATLLTSRTTFVPLALTPWYGDGATPTTLPAARTPMLPEGFGAVALDPERRAGVLTLLPVMVTHAKAGRSDPVGRGALVRRRLLCDTLAAAPPEIPMPPSAPTPGTSQRDQLQRHAEDPACAACHALTDPVGLLFESYDAMGSFRSEDPAGNPIDASGAVPGSDVEGALDGPVALAQALAESEQARACYATQWLRHALGRPEGPDDATTLATLQARFLAADGHVPTLLRALVTSDAFIHRRAP
jgi:hypothetical protein